MKTTYKEALENRRKLEIIQKENCYLLKCVYRKKTIEAISFDQLNVNNFKAKPHEIDSYGHNRKKVGYEKLISHIIKENRN
jgi:hypothetical protein